MSKKMITRTVVVLSPKALSNLREGTMQHSDFYENGMLRSDLDPEYIQVLTIQVRENDMRNFLDKEKDL